MAIKEERRIDSDKVRSICIRMDWYTCGTNAEYSRMFEMCERSKGKADEIYEIAKDITEKSNMNRYYNSGYTKEEVIENVMHYIANDAMTISLKIFETTDERIEKAMIFLGIDAVGETDGDYYTLGDMEAIAKAAQCRLRDVMKHLKKTGRRLYGGANN